MGTRKSNNNNKTITAVSRRYQRKTKMCAVVSFSLLVAARKRSLGWYKLYMFLSLLQSDLMLRLFSHGLGFFSSLFCFKNVNWGMVLLCCDYLFLLLLFGENRQTNSSRHCFFFSQIHIYIFFFTALFN